MRIKIKRRWFWWVIEYSRYENGLSWVSPTKYYSRAAAERAVKEIHERY